MSDPPADQGLPKPRGRRSLPWKRDPVILARLVEVERRYLARETNVAIAEALGVDETTIRRDIERLRELWLERVRDTQEDLRARAVAELDDVKRRALDAVEWDQMCEQAVLFDDVPLPNVTTLDRRPVHRKVHRDEKGSASFRGNKAGALQAARQAIVDKAKLLGISIDKHEVSGPGGVPLALDHRYTDLSDEQLDRRLAELDERAAALLQSPQGPASPDPGGTGKAGGGTGTPAS